MFTDVARALVLVTPVIVVFTGLCVGRRAVCPRVSGMCVTVRVSPMGVHMRVCGA